MMTSIVRPLLLIAVTLAGLVLVFSLPSIPQPPAFHDFADKRTIFGVPNMMNVVSNLGFLLVGLKGVFALRRDSGDGNRVMFYVLFSGLILTGLGSAYYHADPCNERLIWDRAPMAIVFMSLLAVVISAVINKRLAYWLLWPLELIGVGSAVWWYYTESWGFGDLRLFYFVQFYPMLIIPLMLWLYRRQVSRGLVRCLAAVVMWYVAAKLFELWDKEIYGVLPVSGHTLKHLAAGVSTWYFLKMRDLGGKSTWGE